MEKVILYSTHCPHCRGLEIMLKKKEIQYEEVFIDINDASSVKIMLDLGFTSAPGLVVGDTKMDYNQALEWIRGQ